MSETVIDVFGIKKIYPTNTHPNRAKPWLLGVGNWKTRGYDGWGDWDDYSLSTEDNWVIIEFNTDDPLGVGDKGRFPILALPRDEYPGDTISERNQSNLKKRGFMGTKQDWKNVEITLYWKVRAVVNSQAASKHMGISVRGGPHHTDDDPCSGTALYVGLTFTGQPGVSKELRHGDYTDGIYLDSIYIDSETSSDIKDRWIGMKGVFYDKANGNPCIELWLDKNADNNWKRIIKHEDGGGWVIRDQHVDGHPILANKCNGTSDEKITWGGPGVIFKLDGLTMVNMKWASIREIKPPEGWPIKFLLKQRAVPFPVSMRTLAGEYGVISPISLRDLSVLEAERYPFS